MKFNEWWNKMYADKPVMKELCIHCKEIADIAWRAALKNNIEAANTSTNSPSTQAVN